MNTHTLSVPKFITVLISFFIAVIAIATILPSQSAFAATGDGAKAEACLAVGGCDANAGTKVNNVTSAVINIMSIVIGVIAVIMIIIAGAKYITSGGDSGKVSSAKNSIIYALIGLVIVALAQVIVRFVLKTAA